MRLDSTGFEVFWQVSPRVAAMKIQHGANDGRGLNEGDQIRRITLGRLRLKPGGAGSAGSLVAHAKGQFGQVRPIGNYPLCRLYRSLGGKDNGRAAAIRQGDGWKTGRNQRRYDNIHARESLPKGLRKPVRLTGGPGQQDHRRLRHRRLGHGLVGHGLVGLCGHRLGVTCQGAFGQRWMMGYGLTFLGIESSCDDTAAAIVRLGVSGRGEILSSQVEGQTALHADFGGVVPEIAARAHVERLDLCVERALAEAGVALGDLDGIAVTAGPGLIGGVLSGVMLAKGLCATTGLPLIGVNHLAGHALTPRLTDGLAYPYLILLVSGGHCQFLIVHGPERFERLGGTIDDAPGEAFDKVAKLLGLPQPGGPAVEAEARLGDPARFRFPRPLLDRPGCDLSFSGLKTAVLRARDDLIARQGGITVQDRHDLSAGFQAAVAAVLAEKSRRALAIYLDQTDGAGAFAVAGGVAANTTLRAALETVCAATGTQFTAPPLRLCTDNAAMIAWAGLERFGNGGRDGMDLAARPRWPLDPTAAPMIGSGKKGAKA